MDRIIPDIPNPTVGTLHHEYQPYEIVMASRIDRDAKTKTLWYFDEGLVCHKAIIKFNEQCIPGVPRISHITPLLTADGQKIGYVNRKNVTHPMIMDAAMSLRDGDTWHDFIKALNLEIKKNELAKGAYSRHNAEERYKRLLGGAIQPISKTEKLMRTLRVPVELGMFVHTVGTPEIEREFGNPNKNTFDFIRVYVSVKHMDTNTKRDMLRKYKKEIMDMVLLQIKTNKSFKKYGIPVNFLKLSQCVLTRDHQIMFLFELKGIGADLC